MVISMRITSTYCGWWYPPSALHLLDVQSYHVFYSIICVILAILVVNHSCFMSYKVHLTAVLWHIFNTLAIFTLYQPLHLSFRTIKNTLNQTSLFFHLEDLTKLTHLFDAFWLETSMFTINSRLVLHHLSCPNLFISQNNLNIKFKQNSQTMRILSGRLLCFIKDWHLIWSYPWY